MDEVRQLSVEIGKNRLLFLNKYRSALWELKLKKDEFGRKWAEYLLKTNSNLLLVSLSEVPLEPGICQIFSDKESCFVLQKKPERAKLSKMTSAQIGEQLSQNDFADVARIVVNHKISGETLASFSKLDYEENFGILESTGRAAILEEFVRKLRKGVSERESLFVYGRNDNNLFNCGSSVSKATRVNLPNLDYHESITEVVVGSKNAVFVTSLGRVFVSVNRLKSERLSEEKGFMWHADLHRGHHRAMMCSQRFHMNYELRRRSEAPQPKKENRKKTRKYSQRNPREMNGDFQHFRDETDGAEVRKEAEDSSGGENVNVEGLLRSLTSMESRKNKKCETRYDFREKLGDFYNKKRKQKQKNKKKRREPQKEPKEPPIKFRGKRSKKKKSEIRLEKKKLYEWRLLGALTESLYGLSKEASAGLRSLLIPRVRQVMALRSKFVVVSRGDLAKGVTESTRNCVDEKLVMRYIIENKRVDCGDLHVYLRDTAGMLEKVKLPKYLTLDPEEYHIECVKVRGKESTVWIDRHGVFDDSSFL